MGSSSPDSSVHGILQARLLEWIDIRFSRGSSWPRDRTHVSCIAGGFFPVWATREAQSIGCVVINSQKETHLLLVSFPQGFKGVRRESEFCGVNRRITECSVEAGRLSFGVKKILDSPSFPVRGKWAVWGISVLGQRFFCGHLLKQGEVNKGLHWGQTARLVPACVCVCVCVRVCVCACVCACVRWVGAGRLLWPTASPSAVCYSPPSNSLALYEYTVVCLATNRHAYKKIQYTGNTSVKLGGVYLYHEGILQSQKSCHRDLLTRDGHRRS